MLGVTTYNEHGNTMLDQIGEKVDVAKMQFNFMAIRDLELAQIHLEDALTRYNSAVYRINRTWQRADPDKC